MAARTAAEWASPPKLPKSHYVQGYVYTSPEVFAEERAKIFSRTWIFACHESELPEPYDYRVFEVAGQSLFAIRGPDGVIRSFVNACSHRGAKLLHEPAGTARGITCFYHLWTYDAYGACTGVPRRQGYSATELSRASLGLRAVRTEVRLGLVFVNLDDEAAPLADHLGPALDHLDSVLGGVPLEVFHYNRAVIRANWKAWQETNMDIYHEYMHVLLRRTQVKAIPMEARRLEVHVNGHAGSGALKADYGGDKGLSGRGADVPPLPGVDATDFRFADLFPATTIIARGTVIRIDQATPLSPSETLIEMRGLGVRGEPDADRRVRIRHHNQYWGPFGRNVPEDMIAAEACEESFRHGAAQYQLIAREEGRTGQDDVILRHFYAEWGRRLGRSADAPGPA